VAASNPTHPVEYINLELKLPPPTTPPPPEKYPHVYVPFPPQGGPLGFYGSPVLHRTADSAPLGSISHFSYEPPYNIAAVTATHNFANALYKLEPGATLRIFCRTPSKRDGKQLEFTTKPFGTERQEISVQPPSGAALQRGDSSMFQVNPYSFQSYRWVPFVNDPCYTVRALIPELYANSSLLPVHVQKYGSRSGINVWHNPAGHSAKLPGDKVWRR
jgi:hypothetical protein